MTTFEDIISSCRFHYYNNIYIRNNPLTRAARDCLRYVVAIYDEVGTTEVKDEQIFDASNFSILLASGNYTCLFWADYGDANYNAADLTSVTDRKNTAADANAEAFFAKQPITVSDGSAIYHFFCCWVDCFVVWRKCFVRLQHGVVSLYTEYCGAKSDSYRPSYRPDCRPSYRLGYQYC